MNKLSKLDTTKIEVNYTNLAKKYYNTDETSVSEYVSKLAKQSAANSNEPGRVTFSASFVNYFSELCQSSYDAWEKAGKPFRE